MRLPSILFAISLLISIYILYRLILSYTIKQKNNRRNKIISNQFTHALLMLSASLTAGINLINAISELSKIVDSPLREELIHLVNDKKIGLDLNQALDNFSKRIQIPILQMSIAMIKIAHQSGGPLSIALNHIGETMQNTIYINNKIFALTAQGRLQGKILSLLPIFLIMALYFIEPELMSDLWTTESGFIILSIICFLEILGILWIKCLVRQN